MRKKSITLLICVYAALCISYTVVSSAMMPESDDSFLYAEQESSKTTVQSSKSDKSSGSVKNEASAGSESSSPVSENEVSKAVDSDTVSEKNDPESITAEDSQEEINDEDEYQEEKPTLAEFLSGLRCSGCRHNCSLLSPRCMNGARKASQAESTYYSTYGS